MPTDAPPSYFSAPSLPVGSITADIESRLAVFDSALRIKQQGALYLKPVTMQQQIDSVQIMFYGKTYLQSLVRDLAPEPQIHPIWSMAFRRTSMQKG